MEDKELIPEDIQKLALKYERSVNTEELSPSGEFNGNDIETAYAQGAVDERAKQQATTVDVEQLADGYAQKRFGSVILGATTDDMKEMPEYAIAIKASIENSKTAFKAGYQQGVKQSGYTKEDMLAALAAGKDTWNSGSILLRTTWLENYKKSK